MSLILTSPFDRQVQVGEDNRIQLVVAVSSVDDTGVPQDSKTHFLGSHILEGEACSDCVLSFQLQTFCFWTAC
jgi:hypothetical protein